MKKIVSILLSIFLFLNLTIITNANTTSSSLPISEVVFSLRNIEPFKDSLGLSNVNFNNLYIANPLITYEYTDQGFASNIEMYPLLENNTIVAWAIENISGNNKSYQISSDLIHDINTTISTYNNIAILYDSVGCYLLHNSNITLLNKISLQIENRKILPSDITFILKEIELYTIKDCVKLNYSSSPQTRSSYYTELGVEFVSQRPPSNMCWAATIACIANYINGTNLVALNVAMSHYGMTNFNSTLPIGDEVDILSNTYNINYTHRNQRPSDNAIIKNINNNYPLYCIFKVPNSTIRHVVTLYGYHITAGYYFIMDPAFGNAMTTYDSSVGTHIYTSGYSGSVHTFESATCRYWS